MNDPQANTLADGKTLYPIREVSRMTGVNAVTLRAWERRYGLITPLRTSKGHRVYNDQHIARIHTITDWIHRGVPVGKVKSLLNNSGEDIEQLTAQSGDEWLNYQKSFYSALEQFDSANMDAKWNQYRKLYPVEVVTERLIKPLLAKVEDNWSRGIQGAAAERAFLQTHLRNWIGSRIYQNNQSSNSPIILCANLPEESEDSDLHFLALSVCERGGQVRLMAPGLSLSEITIAAIKSRCTGTVLHSHRALRRDTLERGIPRLIRILDHPIAVSGHCSTIHSDELSHLGVLVLGENTGCSVRDLMSILMPS